MSKENRKHRFPVDQEGKARIQFGDYLVADFEPWMGVPVCTNATNLSSGEPVTCSTYGHDNPSEVVFDFFILTAVIEWEASTRVMIVKACWDDEDNDLKDEVRSAD